MLLDAQDLRDILDGACILGAGGGGPYPLGESLLEGVLSAKHPVELVAVDAVPADARLAVAAGVGSPDAASSGFPFDAATHAWDALDARQQPVSGRLLSHVLPGEVGAANSILPMTVAATKGLPIVDGAGAARAIPALQMCTYASRGVPLGAVVLANADEQVSFQAPNPSTADSAMRGIVSSGTFAEDAGVAMWAMDGDVMAKAIIPGTTELARRLGATLREARAGGDPVEAVRAFLGGRVLFRGTIESVAEQTEKGFDLGTVTLTD